VRLVKKLKLALLLVLAVCLLLVVFQNTVPVQVRFLWFAREMPAVILLVLTAAAGFVAGLLTAVLLGRRQGPRS